MSALMLILMAFVIANLPWLTERLFFVIPLSTGKPFWLRLVELIAFYLVSLLVAIWAEMQFSGDVHPQEWEFFVTTFCAYLVLAVPGVVYRYQWLALNTK